ncbi:MAG: thermonuclease family protein [Longimicrobiales bacterium]|nr:thermonuclease family protein [Longimicrobiales bacterium]
MAVLSVYDGDTFTANVSPWPRVTVAASIRVEGVDTPEVRGRCSEEEELAEEARAFVEHWLSERTGRLRLVGPHHGKYAGRIVGRVCADGESLSDALVERGLARPYDGGSREGWCP